MTDTTKCRRLMHASLRDFPSIQDGRVMRKLELVQSGIKLPQLFVMVDYAKEMSAEEVLYVCQVWISLAFSPVVVT